MATTISETSFQTACIECADAIDEGDWSTAHKKLARASIIHAALPVQAGSGSTGAGGGYYLRRKETLAELKGLIDAAEAAEARTDTRRTLETNVGY